MQVTGQATYQFEEPTATFITSYPKMMDPYERSNLYIGESSIAGILHSHLKIRLIATKYHFTLIQF